MAPVTFAHRSIAYVAVQREKFRSIVSGKEQLRLSFSLWIPNIALHAKRHYVIQHSLCLSLSCCGDGAANFRRYHDPGSRKRNNESRRSVCIKEMRCDTALLLLNIEIENRDQYALPNAIPITVPFSSNKIKRRAVRRE